MSNEKHYATALLYLIQKYANEYHSESLKHYTHTGRGFFYTSLHSDELKKKPILKAWYCTPDAIHDDYLDLSNLVQMYDPYKSFVVLVMYKNDEHTWIKTAIVDKDTHDESQS